MWIDVYLQRWQKEHYESEHSQAHLHLPAALWGFVKLAASPLHKLLQMRQMTAAQRTMTATQVVPNIIQQQNSHTTLETLLSAPSHSTFSDGEQSV